MIVAEILTDWIWFGVTQPENHVRVGEAYPHESHFDIDGITVIIDTEGVRSWSTSVQDNHVSEPNQNVTWIRCEQSVIDLIANDGNYMIVWQDSEVGTKDDEDPGAPDGTFSNGEFNQVQNQLSDAGFDQAWLDANTDIALTRRENAEKMKAGMKELPMGVKP